jgi:hypothetical protein
LVVHLLCQRHASAAALASVLYCVEHFQHHDRPQRVITDIASLQAHASVAMCGASDLQVPWLLHARLQRLLGRHRAPAAIHLHDDMDGMSAACMGIKAVVVRSRYDARLPWHEPICGARVDVDLLHTKQLSVGSAKTQRTLGLLPTAAGRWCKLYDEVTLPVGAGR